MMYWAEILLGNKEYSDLVREEMFSQAAETLDRTALRLSSYTGENPSVIRNTALLRISEHVRINFKDAIESIVWIDQIDHLLALWCACSCARPALNFIPEEERRPLVAIETMENLIRGKATLNESFGAMCGAELASTAYNSRKIIHACRSAAGLHIFLLVSSKSYLVFHEAAMAYACCREDDSCYKEALVLQKNTIERAIMSYPES